MRQRFPRYAIQVPVYFRRLDQQEPAQTGIGLTEDLGEGGASLLLEARLAVGCRLGLLIFAKGAIVEAEARVVWTQAQDEETFYHGVEFIQLTPTHLASLLKVLPQERSFRRQAVRIPIRLQASCQVLGANTPALESWIREISRTGVVLVLPQRLSPDTTVEVALLDVQEERHPGIVRWVSRLDGTAVCFHHGIEFTEKPLPPERFSTLILNAFTKESREKLQR